MAEPGLRRARAAGRWKVSGGKVTGADIRPATRGPRNLTWEDVTWPQLPPHLQGGCKWDQRGFYPTPLVSLALPCFQGACKEFTTSMPGGEEVANSSLPVGTWVLSGSWLQAPCWEEPLAYFGVLIPPPPPQTPTTSAATDSMHLRCKSFLQFL